MKRTTISAPVLLPDVEASLAIPPNTRKLIFSSPSNFVIRVSLVQGDVVDEVLGFREGWQVDSEATIQVELHDQDGPVFFASSEPGPILNVEALAR